jgi:hypothetical protein
VSGLFRYDPKASEAEQILIQVKSGKAAVKDMRDLRGALERWQVAVGRLDCPTTPCATWWPKPRALASTNSIPLKNQLVTPQALTSCCPLPPPSASPPPVVSGAFM